MFDELSEKLEATFARLRGRGVDAGVHTRDHRGLPGQPLHLPHPQAREAEGGEDQGRAERRPLPGCLRCAREISRRDAQGIASMS